MKIRPTHLPAAIHSTLLPCVGAVLMLLAFTSVKAAPPNDNLANAQVLSQGPFSVSGTEIDATEEAFEKSADFPFHFASDAKTVWYSYTPDVSGSLTVKPINTAGDGNGTILLLFKGSGTPTSSTFVITNAAANNPFTTDVTAKQQYFLMVGDNAAFAHAFKLEGSFVASVTTPVATVTVPKPEAIRSTGAAGKMLVELSPAPTGGLQVDYNLKGTAVNGIDYALLTGTARVPAGQTNAAIKIKPRPGAMGIRTVRLIVVAGHGYTVGTPHKGKVTIVPSPGK
jgi:hypothetical protein